MKVVFLRRTKSNFTKSVQKYKLVISRFFPIEKTLGVYFKVLNSKDSLYTTYHKRVFSLSKNPTSLPSLEYQFKKSDIGIILQGPISHRQNFTYATILRYLQSYPNAQIILSTWKSERLKEFLELTIEFPNLHILQLDKPKSAGPFNINYQISSTKAGLSKARELELQYVIKSRSDQCLYDIFALDKLRSALKFYGGKDGENRIIFLSLNSFLFRMYGPSDMFQFGKTDQIIKYWDVPFDDRDSLPQTVDQISLRDFSKSEVCEVYVCADYLRRLGFMLDFTMKQNLSIFRDLFIILDSSHVDLLWNKYTYSSDRWAVQEFPHRSQEWNFALWSNLSQNLEYISSFDSYLDSI